MPDPGSFGTYLTEKDIKIVQKHHGVLKDAYKTLNKSKKAYGFIGKSIVGSLKASKAWSKSMKEIEAKGLRGTKQEALETHRVMSRLSKEKFKINIDDSLATRAFKRVTSNLVELRKKFADFSKMTLGVKAVTAAGAAGRGYKKAVQMGAKVPGAEQLAQLGSISGIVATIFETQAITTRFATSLFDAYDSVGKFSSQLKLGDKVAGDLAAAMLDEISALNMSRVQFERLFDQVTSAGGAIKEYFKEKPEEFAKSLVNLSKTLYKTADIYREDAAQTTQAFTGLLGATHRSAKYMENTFKLMAVTGADSSMGAKQFRQAVMDASFEVSNYVDVVRNNIAVMSRVARFGGLTQQQKTAMGQTFADIRKTLLSNFPIVFGTGRGRIKELLNAQVNYLEALKTPEAGLRAETIKSALIEGTPKALQQALEFLKPEDQLELLADIAGVLNKDLTGAGVRAEAQKRMTTILGLTQEQAIKFYNLMKAVSTDDKGKSMKVIDGLNQIRDESAGKAQLAAFNKYEESVKKRLSQQKSWAEKIADEIRRWFQKFFNLLTKISIWIKGGTEITQQAAAPMAKTRFEGYQREGQKRVAMMEDMLKKKDLPSARRKQIEIVKAREELRLKATRAVLAKLATGMMPRKAIKEAIAEAAGPTVTAKEVTAAEAEDLYTGVGEYLEKEPTKEILEMREPLQQLGFTKPGFLSGADVRRGVIKETKPLQTVVVLNFN